MKKDSENTRRRRLAAAVCAAAVLIGGSAGIYAFNANAYSKAEDNDSSKDKSSEAAQGKSSDDGLISGSGTVTSSKLSDELGLKDTSVRLSIEKVLVSEGDSVKSGTQLYQLTADSVTKAKSTLQSELDSANNALLKQKVSYQADKIKAYSLYESQQLLEKTARQEYNAAVSSLDSKLKSAYESYQEAQSTVSKTPSEISQKKTELSKMQKSAEELQQKKDDAQKQLDEAQKKYASAANSYNSTVTQYNSAASVVRYLGAALGKDISGIELAQTVTVTAQEQQNGSDKSSSPSKNGTDGKSFNFPQGTKNTGSSVNEDVSEMPAQRNDQTSGDDTKTKPQTTTQTQSTDITALYEKALNEFNSQKQKLRQEQTSLKSAETEYKTLSESLSKAGSELEKAQSSVSSLEKEISGLESSLSKAKSSLTKLKSEYESLKTSYDTDILTAKNQLDNNTQTYENAKYNYDLTIKTLDSELEKAQTAYDTAAANLSIFEKELADGYIRAKQDATIDTLNYREGRNADLRSAYVYYVDKSELSVTVELDQYDVTKINIGDTAVIYSSETGVTNASITAIAAGEAKTLADVKFNVTVTAGENSNLYSGQSVSVYFNYSGMNSSQLTDRSSEKKKDNDSSGSGRTRPDIGGNMPADFDPSNIPDFGGRKEE